MIQRKGDHAVLKGSSLPEPEPEEVHSFYRDKDNARTPCKNCGRTLVKDRWAEGGWTHISTASIYCDPQPRKARP